MCSDLCRKQLQAIATTSSSSWTTARIGPRRTVSRIRRPRRSPKRLSKSTCRDSASLTKYIQIKAAALSLGCSKRCVGFLEWWRHGRHPFTLSQMKWSKDITGRSETSWRCTLDRTPPPSIVTFRFSFLTYRSAVHDSTQETPALLTFGRELTLPIDLLYGSPDDHCGFESVTSYTPKRGDALLKAYDFAWNNIQRTVRLTIFETKKYSYLHFAFYQSVFCVLLPAQMKK